MRQPPKGPDFLSILSEKTQAVLTASQEPAYAEYSASAQQRYEPWDRTRYRAAGKGLDPTIAWTLIQMQRHANRKPLPLRDIGDQPLTYWLTDESHKQLMLIDQELAGWFGQSDEIVVSKRDRQRFMVNSLMDEAIASSILEGAPTTRRDAKQMLQRGRPPRTHGEQMVVNNYHAMQFVRDHLDTNLTTSFVHQLHRILCRKTMPDDQIGRWRSDDDDINVVDGRDDEIMHEPPSAESLPDRMARLYRFANRSWKKNKPFLHPVIQSIALHFQFAYEHPYCDGNGRVARALFYWCVLRNGYHLFEFLPLSTRIRRAQARYGAAFVHTEQDQFDLNYFIAFNLDMIAQSRAELHAYLEHQLDEKRKAADLLRSDRRLNGRQRLLLQSFHSRSNPKTTIAEYQIRNGVSYPTARQDLLDMVDYGYLIDEKEGRKLVFRTRD